jgi:hypothetical protein
MSDIIHVKVLDDGTFKVETSKISPLQHTNAEGFIRAMVRMIGGKASVKHKQVEGHSHDEGKTYHSH